MNMESNMCISNRLLPKKLEKEANDEQKVADCSLNEGCALKSNLRSKRADVLKKHHKKHMSSPLTHSFSYQRSSGEES